MEEYTKIGFFNKPHALSGEIKLVVDSGFESDLESAAVVFTEQDGQPFPYFVEHVNIGNQIIVKLEDVDNPEDAKSLKGNPIYLKSDLVSQEEEEDWDYLNFRVIDQTLGEVGVIKEIAEYPEQVMAIVQSEDKDILIPLVEAFIYSIDVERKIVNVVLPEGLLDL